MTTIERLPCEENHYANPAGGPSIGEVAGWSLFSLFCEGDYDVDQSVLDQIAAINTAYQQNEYAPRQAAKAAIQAWLGSRHVCDDGSETVTCPICGVIHTMPEFEAMRDAKVAALHTISADIDEEWNARADSIRALIPDASYSAYLDDQE
jgi:hypothetical protein